MGHHTEAFVGIDTSKLRNAIAIADGGRGGEVRFLGEFLSTEVAIRKLVAKLTAKYRHLTFCYEAGPTGYQFASCDSMTSRSSRLACVVCHLYYGQASPRVPGGGSLARSEEGRRSSEDEPARCGKPRQAVARGRAHRGVGAGRAP